MSGRRPVRVLIIGQTPPPIGGQILMIEALVTAHLDGIESRHVRMAYSRDLLENSRFQLRKVAHLASVIGRTWLEMARFRPDVVYYPPGGPNRVPMARDISPNICRSRPATGSGFILRHTACISSRGGAGGSGRATRPRAEPTQDLKRDGRSVLC